MNASKENARATIIRFKELQKSLLSGDDLLPTEELMSQQIDEFLEVVERKLSSEASYQRQALQAKRAKGRVRGGI